jgi:hypothetical protein
MTAEAEAGATEAHPAGPPGSAAPAQRSAKPLHLSKAAFVHKVGFCPLRARTQFQGRRGVSRLGLVDPDSAVTGQKSIDSFIPRP